MATSRPDSGALTRDDLVTGEAVALDLPAVTLPLRLASGLLDILVVFTVFFAAAWLFTIAVSGADLALTQAAAIFVVALVLVMVPTAIETLSRGRSIGKLATGIRIVRDDAGPISFQQAFVRALVGVVEIYLLFGAGAVISMLLSARGKRLGDYAAGTYAVRDRTAIRLMPPAPMPWHLSGWAERADIAPLPPELQLAVRQFLTRAPALTPAARTDLAGRLAASVAPYVAPAPPAGTPPEVYLAAVMAARRDRDAARLAAEDRLRTRLTGRFTNQEA